MCNPNPSINWKDRFIELVHMIDIVLDDKLILFEEANDMWYSRKACDELTYDQMMNELERRLIEAVN